MKSLLVTGGVGFIGSNLTEHLLVEKYKIIILDNFDDYYNPQIKKNNLKEIINLKEKLKLDDKHLKIYKGDIRDKKLIEKVFSENKIDIVIHLAALAGVRPSIDRPTEYFDVNINGTLNLLEICKKSKVNKFIFASSSSVYGNNSIPFLETDNVDAPISPYAASKKAGELICHTYYHLHNISIACLRFFTVYGPRQRPDLAIHKFTKMIFNEEEIPFYGDGNTERDYTYIEDTVNGIIKTIKWIDKEEAQYEIFNLGESNTISLNQMLNTLERVIGKKAIINKLPIQQGDVKKTFADINKSRQKLGYDPKFKFEEGIIKFVNWYKQKNP